MVGGVPAAPDTESGDNAWRNAGEGCGSQQRPRKKDPKQIAVTAETMSTEVDERHHFDVKTAIETGDAAALRRTLAEVPVRANELVRWGKDCRIATHPLHYVSDMLFNGVLPKGKELGLVEVLIQAGADLNFQKAGKDTPLIGAASLGAEEVGLRLLDAGARPELRGGFGETALHWAALLGEDRLAGRLIPGTDLNFKDEKYKSTPLGWAVHGWCKPPAGNHGRQREVVTLLVAAGAKVEPDLLQSERVRTNPEILEILSAGSD